MEEIGLPALGLAPVAIHAAELRGQLGPGWTTAEIETFRLAGDGFRIDAKGRIHEVDGRPAVDVELNADDFDVAEVLRLWPLSVAAEARTWVAQNVAAGKVSAATLHVAGRAAHPDQPDLDGSLTFSDLEVHYRQDVPPATGASGTASLAGDSLTVRLASGRVDQVALGPGEATLSNLLGAGVRRLALHLDLQSSLSAAMRLLDAEPIGIGRKTGLSPDRVGGRQTTSLNATFPLVDPVPDGVSSTGSRPGCTTSPSRKIGLATASQPRASPRWHRRREPTSRVTFASTASRHSSSCG